MLRHLTKAKVEHIIFLSRQIERGSGTLTIPSKKADALVAKILQGDPKRTALLKAIKALSHQERMELIALMSMGRDFSGSFAEAFNAAQNDISEEEELGYIVVKGAKLGQYLHRGLSKVT